MIVIGFGVSISQYTIRLIAIASIPIILTFVVTMGFVVDVFVAIAFFALAAIELHLRISNANHKLTLLANGPNLDVIGGSGLFHRMLISSNLIYFLNILINI